MIGISVDGKTLTFKAQIPIEVSSSLLCYHSVLTSIYKVDLGNNVVGYADMRKNVVIEDTKTGESVVFDKTTYLTIVNKITRVVKGIRKDEIPSFEYTDYKTLISNYFNTKYNKVKITKDGKCAFVNIDEEDIKESDEYVILDIGQGEVIAKDTITDEQDKCIREIKMRCI